MAIAIDRSRPSGDWHVAIVGEELTLVEPLSDALTAAGWTTQIHALPVLAEVGIATSRPDAVVVVLGPETRDDRLVRSLRERRRTRWLPIVAIAGPDAPAPEGALYDAVMRPPLPQEGLELSACLHALARAAVERRRRETELRPATARR